MQSGGTTNKLHHAAQRGSTERTVALLEAGSVDIDQGDPQGWTPLMWSAHQGYARVARILLNKGASTSVADEDNCTALIISAQCGHLAVTKMLVKAGAALEARTGQGGTPLIGSAEAGHSEVASALIKAGANIDSRRYDGATPLLISAQNGFIDVVRMLLRAEANPLLAWIQGEYSILPLDNAAERGHTEMVRELVWQRGIEGCGGPSGGQQALCAAARCGHVDVLAVLTDAGVVDTGPPLRHAAGHGQETAVEFLLQQKGPADGCKHAYVNDSSNRGQTAMMCAIGFVEISLFPYPRIVRRLIDAGADTASTFQLTDSAGTVLLDDTLLGGTTRLIREKKVGVTDATEDQLNKLEAIRRLLLRVEAVHSVSFLWPSNVPSTARTAEGTSTAETASAPLARMLPLLGQRARRRGVPLATLFRYSQKPYSGRVW